MVKRFFILLVFLFCTVSSFAQNASLEERVRILSDGGDECADMDWLRSLESEMKGVYASDSNEFSILAFRKGSIYYEMHDFENAVVNLRKSLDILERRDEDHRADMINICRAIGFSYESLGKYRESLDFQLRALELSKEIYGELSEDVVAAYHNVASVYSTLGDYKKANEYSQKVLDLAEKIDIAPSDMGFIYNNRAALFFDQSIYDEAEKYELMALEIFERDKNQNAGILCNIYGSLASIYAEKGDNERAAIYAGKSVSLADEVNGEDSPANRHVYQVYAEDLKRRGEWIGAIKYYSKIITISTAYSLFDDTLTATLHGFGILMFDLCPGGSIYNEAVSGGAEKQLEESVADLISQVNESFPEEYVKNFYPEYDGCKKLTDVSRVLFHFTIYIRKNVGGSERDPSIAESYNLLGYSFSLDGDYAGALSNYKKSIGMYAELFGEYSESSIPPYLNAGYAYKEMGKAKNAASSWMNALRAMDKSYDYGDTIDSIRGLLDASAYMNDGLLTESILNTAFKTVERSRFDSDLLKNGIMKKALPIYYYAIRFAAGQKDAVGAFSYSEAMRSRGFLDQMGTEAALRLDGVTEKEREEIRSLSSRISDLRKILESKSGEKSAGTDLVSELARTEKRLSELDAEIGKRLPRYAALRNPRTVSAGDAMKWCGKKKAVLEYVLYSEDYSDGKESSPKDSYCIVVTEKKIAVVTLDGNYDYAAAVNKIRKGILPVSVSAGGENIFASESSFEKERNDLYMRLIQPLAPYLKGIDEMVIVPDGNLAFLPFDILRKNASAKDLCSEYSIIMAPSVSVCMLIGGRSPSRTVLAFGGAWYDRTLSEEMHRAGFSQSDSGAKDRKFEIALDESNLSPRQISQIQNEFYEGGAAGYFSKMRIRWSDLPGTLSEIKRLERTVFKDGNIKILEQENASEDALKKFSASGELKNFGTLHFACHGYFDSNVAEMCSVVFSEVSEKIGGKSREDGYLTVPEVSALDINAGMVCLSACETGMGEVRAGDGLVGLSRGFMVAGAKNVGVTLWSVDDAATAEFMVRMYKNQFQGKSYAEAYRAVKNEFQRDSKWSHPFYWAAFALYGGYDEKDAERLSKIKWDDDKSLPEKSSSEKVRERSREISSLVSSGDSAFGKGDYKSALKAYKKAAGKNDSHALYMLGEMYWHGQGVAKSESKAASYYKKAAIFGDVESQACIAFMYENGIGGAKDEVLAFQWYELAASEGNLMAENNLGVMYASMNENEKAMELFIRASENGSVEAKNNLGVMYASGRGCTKDLTKAFSFFEKASSEGNECAELNLAMMYENGWGTTRNYPKAASLYEKRAGAGNAVAKNNLALLYENGLGVSKNHDKAVSLCEQAAKQGNAEAKVNLEILRGKAKSQVSGYTKISIWQSSVVFDRMAR